MERKITAEHSGQKEESLETILPQAKVISNEQISQHVNQVTEIISLILAISFFSLLGFPTGISSQTFAGGSGRTRGHWGSEDILNLQLQFLLSTAHFPARRHRERAPSQWQPENTQVTSDS